MTKNERNRITKILGIILAIAVVVLIGVVVFKNQTPTSKYSKMASIDVQLKLNKAKTNLKLPDTKNLITTQSPIITYRNDKDMDGNDVEIYVQQSDYSQLDKDNLNKIGVVVSDGTNATFELYKTKEKDPLNIVNTIKTMKHDGKKVSYGGYKVMETQYYTYATVEISDDTSLLLTIVSEKQMAKEDINGILDWIQFK